MELKAQQYLKRTAEEANPATDDSSSCNNKSNRPTTKRRLNSISPLKRNVRFADPCEQQVCRKDLFAGLTNEEYYLLCSQMWYTVRFPLESLPATQRYSSSLLSGTLSSFLLTHKLLFPHSLDHSAKTMMTFSATASARFAYGAPWEAT